MCDLLSRSVRQSKCNCRITISFFFWWHTRHARYNLVRSRLCFVVLSRLNVNDFSNNRNDEKMCIRNLRFVVESIRDANTSIHRPNLVSLVIVRRVRRDRQVSNKQSDEIWIPLWKISNWLRILLFVKNQPAEGRRQCEWRPERMTERKNKFVIVQRRNWFSMNSPRFAEEFLWLMSIDLCVDRWSNWIPDQLLVIWNETNFFLLISIQKRQRLNGDLCLTLALTSSTRSIFDSHNRWAGGNCCDREMW